MGQVCGPSSVEVRGKAPQSIYYKLMIAVGIINEWIFPFQVYFLMADSS
jgi:hypothetical protein